jgi:hypothetical protein
MVFRALLDQLPKLDVAGSTPVARSLPTARWITPFRGCREVEQLEVHFSRLDVRNRRAVDVGAQAFTQAAVTRRLAQVLVPVRNPLSFRSASTMA